MEFVGLRIRGDLGANRQAAPKRRFRLRGAAHGREDGPQPIVVCAGLVPEVGAVREVVPELFVDEKGLPPQLCGFGQAPRIHQQVCQVSLDVSQFENI